MNQELPHLDKTVYADNCKWVTIAQNNSSTKRLFDDSLTCRILGQHNINHVGIMNAEYPYEILRVQQSGTFILACISGVGEVLIDGVWKEVRANQACVLPPYMANAFRAIKGESWKFAWVRYLEDSNKKSIANTPSPIQADFDSSALLSIIEGLKHELSKKPNDSVLSCWVNLLHQQVLKFTKSIKVDPRITLIWKAVSKDLAKDWTLYELANLGHLSEEHFRRLNNQQIGRSPMQHIIYLRMLKARKLLMDTNDTVESICTAVGYQNPFTFSNTFKKWMGYRPSSLRKSS